MKLVKLLLIGIVLYISTIVQAQDEEEEDEVDNYRLPRTVLPSAYEIDLVLGDDFFNERTFTGTVRITVTVEEEIPEIILNSADIDEYTDISLTSSSEDVTIDLTHTLNETFERIVLSPVEEDAVIAAGEYSLVFQSYVGKLHEDMYGFYLSSYTNAEGLTEYIATTQFQSTYARRAFPCFDEPNFKAKFKVSIGRPEGYTSLSNTRLDVDASTGTIDVFEETPTMSTYLLAFIVSKFEGYGATNDEEADKDDDGNIIYDVYCRVEALDTAQYAYEVGPQLLAALSTFTAIPYYEVENVAKMHQVAIPDFSAGAMENWGLVTYRETALLWDSEHSTRSYLQRVATVIAHEFTHMWFGDLVTMDWWSHTWLNEGFARYYQYFITAEVETEWELEKQFIIDQQQVIFASDALITSAALSSEASTPSEISSKFGSYSYNKGASVIKMMRNFLGADNFDEGIRDYLLNHQYENTEPADLFTDLGNHAPDDLPTTLDVIMDTWINEPGFPVVNVERSDSGITFTQERFLLDSSASINTKWYVPLTYTTSENPDFEDTSIDEWLHPDQDVEIEDTTGWILVNVLESGYYRVNYDEDLWYALLDALNEEDFSNIPDINRAQIVDDALNLARADKLSYSIALNMTKFLQNDVSYYPWYAAFNAFSFLRRRINSESEAGKHLTTHITTLLEALEEDVSFDISNTISHVNTLKTALALQWACELNQETCTTSATELFDSLVNDGTEINPDLRSTVYCSAIRQAETRDNWDFLWQKFQDTSLATEQITILTALGCSQDEEVLNEYLALSINEDSGIRKQDANYVFTGVLAGNPGNVDIALSFFNDNAEAVVEYYEGMNALSSIITGIANRLTTQEQIDTFETFLTDHAELLSDVSTTAALETAQSNLNWVESNIDELETWLEAHYGSAASVTVNVLVLLVALTTAIKNFF